MIRRSFLKNISVVVAALIIPGIFSGCEDEKTITPKEAVEKHAEGVAVLEYVLENHRQAVYAMDDFGYTVNIESLKDSGSVDLILTLPWYMGPKIEMSKNDYVLNKYSEANFLFTGYGIKSRIREVSAKFKAYTRRNMSEDEEAKIKSTEAILIKLGLDSEVDLFLYIYDKLTSYSAPEVYVLMDYLAKKGVIDRSEILSKEYIDTAADKLIEFMYSNYIDFEEGKPYMSKDKNGVLIWGFTDPSSQKEVHFSRSAYIPYALTFIIMNNIISSDGDWINGI